MKLRTHLGILALGTMLPMLVFAVLAAVFFAQNERETFRRGATERTLALLTAVDTKLRGSVTTLEALASSARLDTGDLRGFHAEAGRVLASQPEWLTINLASPSGQEMINLLRPFGAELPPIAERPSFDRVMQSGKPTVSDLVRGPLTEQIDFAIRVPVVRDGAVRYVLSAVVDPAAITRLLQAQRLPADWVGVVLDGTGRVVARTVEADRTLGQPASESLRAALTRAPEGWFRGSTIEGRPVYTPYNRSPWSGWTVALGIPATAVEAGVWRASVALGVGLVGAAALAFLLAVALGRRIEAPVAALARAARDLGRGDRPPVRTPTHIDELRDLGRVFDDAADAIRARVETQAQLAAIVESSSDAMISCSPQGVIRTWNPGAVRLFGYTAEEIVGRHLSVLVPEARLDELPEILSAVGRGETRAFDTERLSKDGRTIPVALAVSPIRDAAGVVIGASAVLRDIAERQLAEARVRESEERLRLALVGAQQGTWDWDLRARVLTWDERCRAIFGVPNDAPVTYDAHVAALHPDDRERVVKAAVAAAEARTDFSEEYRTFRPDGSMRWVLSRGRAYHDASGAAVRMAGTVFDITERRNAEEALRQADRAKDEFLAMLGHELRNPVGAIAAAADVLDLAGAGDDRTARARAVIGRQVQHLTRLVDDLLDVSRVTSGKVMLDRQPLDLGRVVTAAMSGWRATGRLNRHEVTVAADSVWVMGDETRLEQVLSNLVGNALKYTEAGGRVTVRVAADNDTATLTVSDTGAGIPPTMVESIFDLFVQGDRTLDRAQGGLGLGLTLVRVLAELHGGTVTVESAGRGQGSTFTVRLPRIPETAHRGDRRPPDRLAPEHSRRILLIEDNDDAREMVRLALTLTGHTVAEAADGATGIALLQEHGADVALIDLGLPGLDGYEVARRIRSAEWGKSVRLIALTGYGQPEDRKRAYAAGFDAHLTKPVMPEQLARAIAGTT